MDTSRQKRYYEKNKEKIAEKAKNYYQENKKSIKLNTKLYSKKRRLENKEFIESHKNEPCQICNLKFPKICMDFDHLYDKTKSLAKMISQCASIEDIEAEILKCQLLCSNCHRIKTWQELYKDKPLGKEIKPNRLVKRKYVQNYKESNPCIDCGLKFHFAAMDFDHREPDSKFMEIGKMMGYSLDLIKAEILKCDLVCSNCHRVRHC